jgi:hypothetical protein
MLYNIFHYQTYNIYKVCFIYYVYFYIFKVCIYLLLHLNKTLTLINLEHRHLGPGYFFSFNFINKMCIYNVYEPAWHASLWNKRLYELCPIFLKAFISQRSMSNGFIYVVDAHFNDKIEEKKKYPGPKCLYSKLIKVKVLFKWSNKYIQTLNI